MRDIPVGNGTLLVTFDDRYQIRDVYFPHVGQENHAGGAISRFGLWIDGEFSWLASDEWSRTLAYLPETLVTDVTLKNDRLGIEIACSDTVASHENLFLRRIRVSNLRDNARAARIFLHHDLRIYENPVGDTAYFDPPTRALIHYKKHRYFLFNTEPRFASFATGRKAFREKEGTWRDAEDGFLSGGPITEGSVDSTIGVHADIPPNSNFEFFCWMAAGFNYDEVAALDAHVRNRSPQNYFDYTANYWRAWVNKNDFDFEGLSLNLVQQYKRSLLIIKTQCDRDGAIVAANDSDVTERATDHYSYLWTRDGAFVANALDLAGYSHMTRRFFDFCLRIVHPDGYFLQKYNPDGTVASGWHPAWDSAGQTELLPIQEDETALVLWALWEHYERFRDIEFAHRMYTGLVLSCAEFMSDFVDTETGLPLASWNLWEDRRGVHSFTCAAVIAGLRAAANFAELFSEKVRADAFRGSAAAIAASVEKYLYSADLGRFIRGLECRDGRLEPDAAVDASLFGLFYFGVFSAADPRIRATMRAIEEKLKVGSGVSRFENDGYMRLGERSGNAWFICSLWLAEYYCAAAHSADDLQKCLDILSWTAQSAFPSGVLAEQIDVSTGKNISVSPLTWSHSTFVAAVHSYLKAKQRLSFASADSR